ncbi:MAG TPA: FecR domain-containing protein [Allosphingosinicella sp.]
MLKRTRQIEEEAVGWVIRLRGDDADWEGFTAWLEADPAHAAAYDEAALADAEAGSLPPARQPAPAPVSAAAAPVPARRSRRFVIGWGVAAGLALVAGYAGFGLGPGARVLETAPGQRREVALPDGSRIEMNGGTRVVLEDDRPRFARIERGEALFRVVHDPARPFEVEAGETRLRDLGTVFNVVRGPGTVEVSVSEGAVLYNPGREAASLRAGMGLRKSTGSRLWIGKIDRESVGSWRNGRLIYDSAPIARVASELGRSLGVELHAADDVAARPFSGIIILEGERGALLERSAALLGVALRREREGWVLTSRAGDPR